MAIIGDLVTRSSFLRDYRGGREKGEALIALARESGFSFYEALGPVLLGQVAVQEGAIDEGIHSMLGGMETLKAARETLAYHAGNDILAEAFLTAGRPNEGLAAVNEAIAAADQLQIRFCE